MSRGLVSVVMPALNAEATIGAAVESVLWQDYPEVEVIVVDDGSTDRTAAIATAHGERVTLVQQSHKGVAAARNAGVEAARGELISLCDADDLLFEQHLSALAETHAATHDGIATANSYWLLPGGIHRSKRRYKGSFPAPERQRVAILEQNFVSTLSLFSRRLFERIGGFEEGRRYAEDWDFWIRAIFAGARVALQPRPLALYRWGTAGLSSDFSEMDAGVEEVLATLETRVPLEEEERRYLDRRLSSPGPRVLVRDGDAALRAGHYGEAARAYDEAAGLCPSERMLVWKARALKPFPQLSGPLLRARQLRLDRQLGIEEGHTR